LNVVWGGWAREGREIYLSGDRLAHGADHLRHRVL
jgi:hypothetical protein